MPGREERAVAMMDAGANCAQAVLGVFCRELGLEKGSALRISSGFGAGMGRRQEVCGAVTGAVMAIGLKYGSADPGDREAKETVYRLTRELMSRFQAEFGSCLCRELLGCDLQTDEGRKQYEEKGLGTEVCRPCVRGAVRFLEKIL